MTDADTAAALHPFYRAIIDAYAQAGRPFFHQLSPGDARAMLDASLAAAPSPVNLPQLAEIIDAVIPGPHGPIPIRRYRPQGGVLGQCLYFHSGGWVLGGLDQADTTCRRLAAAAGCEVISVAYRLAPEHPFPQPLDDAYAALTWAADRGPPLVIAGESAGGNLVAACAIRARDEGMAAIAGMFLGYPVTDAALDTASYKEIGDRNWLLSTKDMAWFWDQYCPDGIDRSHPWLSPLRVADAAHLPPTMICLAELDPLREEGLAFADRLSASGVPVVLRRDAAVTHGYLAAAGILDVSTAALAQAGEWIRTTLHAASTRETQTGGRDGA
ncbi:alpha/beta hydrolase [Sphingomonas sp. BIUV-7]|uniref:Alpha/beta hydrolase n=1 Tax=Sphingomonas natans TaxID=3063330 RepID=A0ABT8Y8D9_9SPHN|nr:alpha/beta hydrolase [Sphingomonas sp. BIUV-7]MDO6414573.1 alpha/beta hydrolase [Sphingomonas sp. BIUV-7]